MLTIVFPVFNQTPTLDLSDTLCENLHLSPRAQAPLAKRLQGIVALYAPFVVAFGTLSRPSRAVAETSIRVHHCPSSSLALDGRVELPTFIWRKQIFDLVHVVEVSDSARHCPQGLHYCLFGWRASCRLQLLEVCKPLSQCQQQLRLFPSRDGLGKPLVKRCRVLCHAGQYFVIKHSQDPAT